MRKIRKNDYKQRRIKDLTEQVSSLKNELTALEKENAALKKICETNNKAVEDMQSKHKNTLERYSVGLEEVKSLKAQYEAAIKSVNEAKSEYICEVQSLIRKMKKHK